MLTAVWFDHNILIDLFPDLIYTDAPRFFMADDLNIRLVSMGGLLAGLAFPAGISVFLKILALQTLYKNIIQ